MIDADQLRRYVVGPALRHLSLWSEAAENLVLGTWATESHLGSKLHQVGGGPARGPGQMEPATHADIWASYLRYPDRKPLADTVMRLAPPICWTQDPIVRVDSDALVASLWYAAAMTRLQYRRYPEPLPAAGDWHGMAVLYKARYNTPLGKGSVEKFLRDCAACGLVKAA